MLEKYGVRPSEDRGRPGDLEPMPIREAPRERGRSSGDDNKRNRSVHYDQGTARGSEQHGRGSSRTSNYSQERGSGSDYGNHSGNYKHHSSGDHRDSTPMGWGKDPESDDYHRRYRQREPNEQEKMLKLRSVDTQVVLLENGSHRSLWTGKTYPRRNPDKSCSWKGNKDTQPPQL